MNYLKNLDNKIKNKKAGIAVIGLGYVGIPVACIFAKSGFNVVGVNRGKEKVNLIKKGKSPIEGKEPGLESLIRKVIKSKKLFVTTDYSYISNADVIIVAVETPVDSKDKIPKYESLKSALESIAKNMRKGALVIIESTIASGTMKNIVIPVLERKSRMKVGKDFYVGHCPERVMPGKLLKNIINYHRVVGGSNKKISGIMVKLYKNFVKGTLDPVSLETAEIVKTAENYYRDVEIAFANQLALTCENFGANILKVRNLVNKVEDRNIHLPGAGVGGHCIPKDGYLNVAFLRKKGGDAKLSVEFADLARKINDFMPIHTVNLLKSALKEKDVSLKSSRIAILGYAYLANSDDTRNSPTESLVKNLKGKVRELRIHDPYVKKYNVNLKKILKGADVLVLMTAHDQYKKLSLSKIKSLLKTLILVDGRNIYSKEKAEKIGFIYKGVGNT